MVTITSSEVLENEVKGNRRYGSLKWTFDEGEPTTHRAVYFPLATDLDQELIDRAPQVLASHITSLRRNQISNRMIIARDKFNELLDEKTLEGIDLVQADFQAIGQRMNQIAQWIRDNPE